MEGTRTHVNYESCQGTNNGRVYMLWRGRKHENVFTDKRGSSGYCDKSNASPLYMCMCDIIYIHTHICIDTFMFPYVVDHIMMT